MIRRGILNHNPFNIKEGPNDTTDWVGERATDDDPIFEEFTAPEYGIRAGIKILRAYNRRGINTIHTILYTFAPPNDKNDTEAYIKSVVTQTGIDQNTPIDIEHDRNRLQLLATAIIKHENGMQPYSFETIARGINMGFDDGAKKAA